MKINICPGDDLQKDRTCWTIQINSYELNWAKCRTFHERNSLSLVRLMKRLTFGLGLTLVKEVRQGAKKTILTACLSGKLKLEFTSPDVISNGPKPFWRAELISQFFCYSNSSKNITCPSGKLKTEFTCPIAKSTSPGLSDTTFFAHCQSIGSW